MTGCRARHTPPPPPTPSSSLRPKPLPRLLLFALQCSFSFFCLPRVSLRVLEGARLFPRLLSALAFLCLGSGLVFLRVFVCRCLSLFSLLIHIFFAFVFLLSTVSCFLCVCLRVPSSLFALSFNHLCLTVLPFVFFTFLLSFSFIPVNYIFKNAAAGRCRVLGGVP